MNPSLLLLPILSVVVTVLSVPTKILLPLYIYPSPSAWDPLYATIAAYPLVVFQIIVNPNSGPGTNTSSSCPDENYIIAIDRLNSYANVETLGYTHLSYGGRAARDVRRDVEIYAGWKGNCGNGDEVGDGVGRNVAMNGIFFDESPNTDEVEMLEYTALMADYARNTFSSSSSSAQVVFNMGTTPLSLEYYEQADTIVVSETARAYYADTTEGMAGLVGTNVPSGKEANSSVLVHSFDGSMQDLRADVDVLVESGLGSLFFTTDCCWNDVVAGVASLENVVEVLFERYVVENG